MLARKGLAAYFAAKALAEIDNLRQQLYHVQMSKGGNPLEAEIVLQDILTRFLALII